MKEHDKNLALKVLLGVLCLVAVGVIVGIVAVVNSSNKLSEEEESVATIQDAYASCNEIKAGYTTSGDKTYAEVIAEFEVEALKGGNDYYVDYLTCYAQFVFAYGNGFGDAMEVMDRAEGLLDEVAALTRSGYYYTYSYFYEKIGDLEKVEYYNILGAQGSSNDMVMEDK